MTLKTLFAGFAFLMLAACDVPKTHKIVLDDGAVSTEAIQASVGDTLRIYHDDEHGDHALHSTDEHHSFDLSHLSHGDHYDLTLVHPGTFTIQCHNMDHMKIVIEVAE